MSSFLESVLPFVFILVVLVVIHEAGHFFTAKLFGVKVLEFGIGYPPRAWGFKRGDTEYTINILPLGGFVRLLGEEDPTDPQSLAAQKAWKRLVVMGAGSFMNFALAITLFSVALMIPREVQVGRAVISQVVPGSPAAEAGIKSGDIIQTIDGRNIESVSDASYNIRLHLGERIKIVLARPDALTRESTTETVEVTPRWSPPDYLYPVKPGDNIDSIAVATGFDRSTVRMAAGIPTELEAGKQYTITTPTESIPYTAVEGDTVESVGRKFNVTDAVVAQSVGFPDQNTIPASMATLRFQQGATGIRIAPQFDFTESRSLKPWTAVQRGWQATFDSLKLFRNEIISWVKGGSSAPVSGPIGIAQATGEIYREAGWKSLVDLAALLSINLAILNIMPLPMLDGGRMAFVLIEMARRGRRIAPAKEAMVHLVGMAALLILVVALSYFDVARIVRGDSLFR